MTQSTKQSVTVVAVAIAINLALFWALALLNRTPHVEHETPPVLTVSLRHQTPPRPQVQEQTYPMPLPAPQTPPMPKLSVEPPSLTPQVEPVDLALNLNVPSPGPVLATQAPPAPAPTPPAASPPAPQSDAASEPMDSDQVDQPPRELPQNPQPEYPSVAQRRGIEGSVTVKLLIDEAGHVQQIRVLQVRGHSSFEEAVQAVLPRWRFEPAVHQGRRVPVWGVKTIGFEVRSN